MKTKKLSNKEYNSPYFLSSRKQDIQDLVQKEANNNWAKLPIDSSLPKYKKCDGIKYTAGWINFIKTVIIELKP